MTTSFIFTLVFAAVVIIAAVLVFKYFSGKNKPQSQKSSMESIASTIGAKLNRSLSDFANGLRDMETVKEEIFHFLAEAEQELANDYRSYLKNLITARETYSKIISSAEKKIPTLRDKAKEYKSKFEASNNPKEKEWATRYIEQMLTYVKTKDNAQTKLDAVKEKIEDAGILFDIERSKIETKRIEIIDLTCTPDSLRTIAAFNINDLTSEFRKKLEEHNINLEVENKMNETSTSDTDVTNTSTEIEDAFAKL